MSFRASTVGLSRSTVYYPRPTRPGVWRAPGDMRASSAMRALKGLLGLGTDVAPAASTIQMTTDPGAYITPSPSAGPNTSPAPGTVTTTITATLPTQSPDGSMSQSMPVMTSTVTTPKKWYSFLETTKPDGTVTGPLGMSWTTWFVGGGAAALLFASRNSSGGASSAPGESTPNTRRRKKARRNRRRR